MGLSLDEQYGIESLTAGTITIEDATPALRARTPGYRTVAADGGVFTFGAHGFVRAVVAPAPAPAAVALVGRGASAGYAVARADGSTWGASAGGLPDFTTVGGPPPAGLRPPIVGAAAHPSEPGYWLVGSDGGVLSFGDASFHGSTGDLRLNSPIVGIAA